MEIIITLIVVGLLLMFAEVLIIPGVGVAGILGVCALVGSCWYAFWEMGTLTGCIVTIVNAILLIVLTVIALRAKTWKKISLDTNIDSTAGQKADKVSVGDIGRAKTRLAPMGEALFGDEYVEVKAMEEIIYPEAPVQVVRIDDNKIYVKEVKE